MTKRNTKRTRTQTSSRTTHTTPPREAQAAPGRGWASLLTVLLFGLIAVRVALVRAVPAPPPSGLAAVVTPTAAALPAAPTPSPAAAPRVGVVPTVTPTAPVRALPPASTPLPQPTDEPLRLAVERSVREQFDPYFTGLDERYEGLRVLTYPRNAPADDEIVRQTGHGLVHWGPPSGEVALLLREEPYAAVAHITFPRHDASLHALRAMAEGKDQTYHLVCGDDGALVRMVLGVEALAESTLYVEGWEAAKEHVATHDDAWALLPWAVVDHRVQTLTVEGQRLHPARLQGYPLVRRLYLEPEPPLSAIIASDLAAALHYDPGPTVELVAVGDVMLGRLVGERIAANEASYPFRGEGVEALLTGADITFANLECPISEGGQRQSKTYTFRADPEAVDGLLWAGFDILSLANNHCGDFGDEALVDTLDALDAAGIARIGAGRTITEAQQLAVLDVDGLRLGMLAANQIPPTSFAATAESPGSSFAEPAALAEALRASRERADVLIVSCHWGNEYAAYPTANQQRTARILADAGAALVIGHHPHVIQGLEYGAETLVAYSLGNFVFDMGVPGTSEGLALRCLIDASGVKTAELLPYRIVQSQPQLLTGEEGEALVRRALGYTAEQGGLPRPLPTPTVAAQ